MTAQSNPQQTGAVSSSPVETEKKKKKKKKYSRFRKFPQEAEFSIAKGGHRLARAVEEALSEWRSSSTKSARKKRDGAVRDALKNYGKALSKFGREASKISEDVADSFPKLKKLFR